MVKTILRSADNKDKQNVRNIYCWLNIIIIMYINIAFIIIIGRHTNSIII